MSFFDFLTLPYLPQREKKDLERGDACGVGSCLSSLSSFSKEDMYMKEKIMKIS
jgi:hypothetical protein